MRVAVLAASHN